MKKIVCFVDFSSASDNALRYATRLALDTSSKLILVSLQQDHKKRPALVGANESGLTYYSTSRLPEMCDQLRGAWKVRCDYKELTVLDDEEIDLIGKDVMLVVAGIESAGEMTPYRAFSSLESSLIKDLSTPVLLVPINFQYQRPTRVLYANDYANEPNPPLERLEQLSSWLKSDIRFLSVIQGGFSPEEEDKIDKKNAKILSHWNGKPEISFDYVYHTNVAECLDHYMGLWKMDDMIVFSISQMPLAKRLFHRSVIKDIRLCSDYPMLIVHNAL
jgi:hypothetical protein